MYGIGAITFTSSRIIKIENKLVVGCNFCMDEEKVSSAILYFHIWVGLSREEVQCDRRYIKRSHSNMMYRVSLLQGDTSC